MFIVDLITQITLLVLPFIVVVVPKGSMVLHYYKCSLELKNNEVSMPRRINCYTPLYNSVILQSLMGNSTVGAHIINVVVGIMIIFGLVCRLVLYSNPWFQLFGTINNLAFVLIWYIYEVVLSIKLARSVRMGWKTIFAVIPCVLAFFSKPYISTYFKKHSDYLHNRFKNELEDVDDEQDSKPKGGIKRVQKIR